jgi:hypothetical protein
MGWRLPVGMKNSTWLAVDSAPVFVSGHWSLPPELLQLLTSSIQRTFCRVNPARSLHRSQISKDLRSMQASVPAPK